MTSEPVSAEDRFAKLVAEMIELPDVTPPASKRSRREFGANALKVRGRIFAMLVRGQLVLKLPAQRVTSLIGAGAGSTFDAGKGAPMREWVTLAASSDAAWRALATEAMHFVRGDG